MDPYTAFKSAFEEQQLKIEVLYERLSRLEELNKDVVTFVRQNGNLPSMDALSLRNSNSSVPSSGIHPEELPLFSRTFQLHTPRSNQSTTEIPDVKQDSLNRSVEELISDADTSTQSRSHPDASSPSLQLLSDIVQQQTAGLGSALQNLGLEDTARDQLMKEIRTNLNAILSAQLMRDKRAGQRSSPPSTSVSASVGNPPHLSAPSSVTSSGGDGSSSTMPPTFIHSEQRDPHSGCSPSSNDIPDPCTPVNSATLPESQLDCQSRRRRELLRLNKRMTQATNPFQDHVANWGGLATSNRGPRHLPITEPARPATLPRYTCPSSVPDGDQLAVAESLIDPLLSSSYQTDPCARMRHSTTMDKMSSIPGFFCPCGDSQTCPLTPAQQYYLSTDARVNRGFARIAALFRGRFIRELLATHKVYDLIRTIKDTAKLVLSMHVERQPSDAPDGTLSASSLTNEEVILENRLMAQLRSALTQLHDIFFRWPLQNQIELLRLSRSVMQRNRRLATKSLGSCDESLPSQPDLGCTGAGAVVTRPAQNPTPRKWESIPLRRHTESCNQNDKRDTRVLRQIQPHEVDRFGTQILAVQRTDGIKENRIVPNSKPDSTGLRRLSRQPKSVDQHLNTHLLPGSLSNKQIERFQHNSARIEFSANRPERNASRPATHSTPVRASQKEDNGAKENITPLCATPPARSRIPVPHPPPCSDDACATSANHVTPSHSPRPPSGGVPFSTQRRTAAHISALATRRSSAIRTKPGSRSVCQSVTPDTCKQPPTTPFSSSRRPMSGSLGQAISQSKSKKSAVPVDAVFDRPTSDPRISHLSTEQQQQQVESDIIVTSVHNRHHIGRTRNPTAFLSSPPIQSKRPISGPLGQTRQQVNANHPTTAQPVDKWYPVRKRIVASSITNPQPGGDLKRTDRQSFIWPCQPSPAPVCFAKPAGPTVISATGEPRVASLYGTRDPELGRLPPASGCARTRVGCEPLRATWSLDTNEPATGYL